MCVCGRVKETYTSLVGIPSSMFLQISLSTPTANPSAWPPPTFVVRDRDFIINDNAPNLSFTRTKRKDPRPLLVKSASL